MHRIHVYLRALVACAVLLTAGGAAQAAGALAVVPTVDGKRGNPVVWSRRFFPDLMAIEGDIGARNLIGRYPEAVTEVPVTGRGAFVDVDTPDALQAIRAEIERA